MKGLYKASRAAKDLLRENDGGVGGIAGQDELRPTTLIHCATRRLSRRHPKRQADRRGGRRPFFGLMAELVEKSSSARRQACLVDCFCTLNRTLQHPALDARLSLGGCVALVDSAAGFTDDASVLPSPDALGTLRQAVSSGALPITGA